MLACKWLAGFGWREFWRYRDNAELKIARTTSDAMGMMATIMNARF